MLRRWGPCGWGSASFSRPKDLNAGLGVGKISMAELAKSRALIAWLEQGLGPTKMTRLVLERLRRGAGNVGRLLGRKLVQ